MGAKSEIIYVDVLGKEEERKILFILFCRKSNEKISLMIYAIYVVYIVSHDLCVIMMFHN